jgi:hypothetical protein
MAKRFLNHQILILTILMLGCNQPEAFDPRHPKRPADVPKATCDGTPIDWTWKKQRAFEEGRIFFERDSSGCVLAVIIKIK